MINRKWAKIIREMGRYKTTDEIITELCHYRPFFDENYLDYAKPDVKKLRNYIETGRWE